MKRALEDVYGQYLPKHTHPFLYLSLRALPLNSACVLGPPMHRFIVIVDTAGGRVFICIACFIALVLSWGQLPPVPFLRRRRGFEPPKGVACAEPPLLQRVPLLSSTFVPGPPTGLPPNTLDVNVHPTKREVHAIL